MDFIAENIQHYAEQHTSAESPLLYKIYRETHLHVLKPRMLSGHLQGRFLAMFSRMIRPRRVLEIGTYTGYTAICLAEGLSEDGILYTIDINAELAPRVKGYLHESGLNEKVNYLIGNAIEIIPTLKEQWDLVFIDADKENYANYYRLAKEKLRKGGYIIADNVLWSGKVANPTITDKDTENMRLFNNMIANDDEVVQVLMPVRDGLLIVEKL